MAPFKAKPWQAYASGLVGLWLLISPILLSYQATRLKISDMASGLIALSLSAAALRSRGVWPQWALAAVGFWLLAAPLFMWAPDLAAYLNDTLAGIALFVFAVILPYAARTGGPDIPETWSYNPSAWLQRIPIIIIGLLAYFAASYMAFYQLGYIKTAWDPFFGDGTHRVLTSDVSKAFPVSDAGLGALAYLLEAISGLIGDTRRWRTMPWMAFLFWVLVVPAGVVSIVLVMLQPIAVGAWCTLCLVTAFLTLITIPPAMDEFILTAQFLMKRRREGRSLWKLIWLGEVDDAKPVERADAQPAIDLAVPWNLALAAALGLGLMAAPVLLDIEKPLANSHFMTGALVVTFAVIGMAEVGRPFRLFNCLLGLWAAAAPWFLSGGNPQAVWIDAIAGGLIVAFSLPGGEMEDRHGAWDRFILKAKFPLRLPGR